MTESINIESVTVEELASSQIEKIKVAIDGVAWDRVDNYYVDMKPFESVGEGPVQIAVPKYRRRIRAFASLMPAELSRLRY